MNLFKLFLFISCSFVIFTVSARHYRITKKENVYKKINSGFPCYVEKDKLSVVYLNVKEKKKLQKTDRVLYSQLKSMKNILRELSKDLPEINFITALLSESDLINLIDELDKKNILLKHEKYEPIFLVFKNGMLARDANNKPVVIVGFTNSKAINDLIINNFEENIKNIRKLRLEKKCKRNDDVNQTFVDFFNNFTSQDRKTREKQRGTGGVKPDSLWMAT